MAARPRRGGPGSLLRAGRLAAADLVRAHVLAPLYALRRFSLGFDFRYDLARVRFHLGGVLDGSKAVEKLGYTPATGIEWPRSGEQVRLAG